jgi:putative DNA methylase
VPANPDTARKGFFQVDYPKRLIEVDLPIKRISAHARREKSIRHGHISTLHIWWARRPLAACRAVICAALWPDPADENCPPAFREEARRLMTDWAKNHLELTSPESMSRFNRVKNDPKVLADNGELRKALLDFIADFANWDNSTSSPYLTTSRALTHAAHTALGGTHGPRPLVVDPFAGGGAIPLEALRAGADAFASDLNPVPVLLNRMMLELIPKAPAGLHNEVRKWGAWVREQAVRQLSAFYPKDPDGATPIAYMWARTIKCEGPGCGIDIPLLRSLWLAKKSTRSIAIQLGGDRSSGVDFSLITKQGNQWVDLHDHRVRVAKPSFDGTVKRGSATCPCCGYTTPAAQLRKQLSARRGGTRDAQLVCVVTTKADQAGRFYRLPTEADRVALSNAGRQLDQRERDATDPLDKAPHEPTPEGKGKGAGRAFSQRNYGMAQFRDAYTARQLLTLTTLSRIVRTAADSGMPAVVRILMAFAVGRVNDLSMSLCRWLTSLEAVAAANGGQNRMPVVLDFVEANPFGGSGGDWLGQIDWVARVVEELEASQLEAGSVGRCPAQKAALPEDSADALVTDPPYYDAFPYSDLSDFFFVWLKRALGPESMGYSEELVPKDEEAVVYEVAHGGPQLKDRVYFQREMTAAFTQARLVTIPRGIGVVVFANKTTEGWESLIQSILDAGWVVTASWPIDTERPNRQRAMDSAALGSSVHVVCRPRENPDGSPTRQDIGDWRGVLASLPLRIREWLPRLASEGVVGADAIFACLGPALEIFSRYSRVEKASGEVVTLREYLEQVWGAVSTEALSMIFRDADAAGLESDARFTAIVLWTLGAGGSSSSESSEGESEDAEEEDDDEVESAKGKTAKGGYTLEYDAARKIAQGLGVKLEQIDSVVEVKGGKARLRPVSERAATLFGKAEKADAATKKRGRKATQKKLFDKEAEEGGGMADTVTIGEGAAATPGATALDRVHQAMLLFAGGRADALKRFIIEDGVGGDARFWKLAQSLSALYPAGSDEKRWVDGVLARKKSFGF